MPPIHRSRVAMRVIATALFATSIALKTLSLPGATLPSGEKVSGSMLEGAARVLILICIIIMTFFETAPAQTPPGRARFFSHFMLFFSAAGIAVHGVTGLILTARKIWPAPGFYPLEFEIASLAVLLVLYAKPTEYDAFLENSKKVTRIQDDALPALFEIKINGPLARALWGVVAVAAIASVPLSPKGYGVGAPLVGKCIFIVFGGLLSSLILRLYPVFSHAMNAFLCDCGVRVKSARIRERIAGVNTVVLGMKSALTRHEPTLWAISTLKKGSELDALALADRLVRNDTNFAYAKALLDASERLGIEISDIKTTRIVERPGVKALIAEEEVLLGKREYLESNGVKTTELNERAGVYELEGNSCLYLSRNGAPLAIFAFHRTMNPTCAEAVIDLIDMKIDVTTFVDIDQKPANALAAEAHIVNVASAASGKDSGELVTNLLAQNKRVLTVALVDERAISVRLADDGDLPEYASADVAAIHNNLQTIPRIIKRARTFNAWSVAMAIVISTFAIFSAIFTLFVSPLLATVGVVAGLAVSLILTLIGSIILKSGGGY